METKKRSVGRPTKKCKCEVCGETNVEEFYKTRKNRCKTCLYDSQKQWVTENYLRDRLLQAKHRALRKNLPFELTDEIILEKLIEQESKCYISKVPLTLVPDHWDSISFDRLDSKLGYTVENTILVTKFVNISKSTMDLDTFHEHIEIVYKGIRENL